MKTSPTIARLLWGISRCRAKDIGAFAWKGYSKPHVSSDCAAKNISRWPIFWPTRRLDGLCCRDLWTPTERATQEGIASLPKSEDSWLRTFTHCCDHWALKRESATIEPNSMARTAAKKLASFSIPTVRKPYSAIPVNRTAYPKRLRATATIKSVFSSSVLWTLHPDV